MNVVRGNWGNVVKLLLDPQHFLFPAIWSLWGFYSRLEKKFDFFSNRGNFPDVKVKAKLAEMLFLSVLRGNIQKLCRFAESNTVWLMLSLKQ